MRCSNRHVASARKLGFLCCLYFVQGLPFGFQSHALQLYLLERGVSLTGIGFASALALPWMLKILVAPVIDRWHSRRFGRRRTWILPLQAGLGSTCLAASFVPPDEALWALLGLVFAMNAFAAAMDVAVDGLAIDTLAERDLGYGNIAQVVGYKLGMLAGGGFLVWASEFVGWRELFFGMGGLVGLVAGLTWLAREPPPSARTGAAPPPTMIALLRALADALARPGMGWLVVFAATYKLGESMADQMFKPYLYGVGFSRAEIGQWVITWGMGFSIVGSVVGGVLAGRAGLLRAVAITATLRAFSVGGEWWLSTHVPSPDEVILVTALEQLCGGALTTAMFALMMGRVDARIGATHYTLLATVEVAGKAPGPFFSGLIADAFGLPAMFGLATVLSFLFLGLLWPIARVGPDQRPDSHTSISRRSGS
jgi:MFS family permease